MNAKTYRVSSMQEALRLIREELGPDASVLHTREINTAWWRRLAGAPRIEVVAAADVEAPSRLVAAPRPAANGLRAAVGRLPALIAPNESPPIVDSRPSLQPRRTAPPAPEAPPPVVDGTRKAAPAMTARPAAAARTTTTRVPRELRAALRSLHDQMRAADLPIEAAREYIERLRGEASNGKTDPRRLRTKLLALLETEFKATGSVRITPGKRRMVALIGPTGVGKTTTIAKLAANYQLRQRCRVGLITVDTFRIAAADQLRTYADIIGVPLEVVATPTEMARALGRLADRDLVFLDTSGHGPRDEVRVGELRSMLAHARPDEIHLVLSATSSGASHQAAARLLAETRATALLVTKLDEAPSLGALWPLLRKWRWPVSYFTGGQNVPDDIEPATAATLARRMLGLSMGAAHV